MLTPTPLLCHTWPGGKYRLPAIGCADGPDVVADSGCALSYTARPAFLHQLVGLFGGAFVMVEPENFIAITPQSSSAGRRRFRLFHNCEMIESIHRHRTSSAALYSCWNSVSSIFANTEILRGCLAEGAAQAAEWRRNG